MTSADQPTTEPSEADVAAFKRGWHKADQNRHQRVTCTPWEEA